MSAEDFKRGAIDDDTATFSQDSAESDLAAAGVESAMVFRPSRGSVIFPKIMYRRAATCGCSVTAP